VLPQRELKQRATPCSVKTCRWGALSGRAEMTEPSFTSRSAFVASAIYYAIAYVLEVIAPREAAGLVVTALVSGCVADGWLAGGAVHVMQVAGQHFQQLCLSAFILKMGRRLEFLTPTPCSSLLIIRPQMVQSLLTEPLGRPLDFTEPIADWVHAVR
jgi:hypothetical protein